MAHAIDLLLYADYLLHDIDALVILATLGKSLTFLSQFEQSLS